MAKHQTIEIKMEKMRRDWRITIYRWVDRVILLSNLLISMSKCTAYSERTFAFYRINSKTKAAYLHKNKCTSWSYSLRKGFYQICRHMLLTEEGHQSFLVHVRHERMNTYSRNYSFQFARTVYRAVS